MRCYLIRVMLFPPTTSEAGAGLAPTVNSRPPSTRRGRRA